MLALYENFRSRERMALRLALHVVMAANACLGLVEFAFDFHLTPFVIGGTPILGDYRSTALLGHPLLNAATTARYAAMLNLGGVVGAAAGCLAGTLVGSTAAMTFVVARMGYDFLSTLWREFSSPPRSWARRCAWSRRRSALSLWRRKSASAL